MLLRDFDIWCFRWRWFVTELISCTWTGMAFSFHLLTGHSCWLLCHYGAQSLHHQTQLTLERMPSKPQMMLSTSRLDIICFTHWQLSWTSYAAPSIGSCSVKSNSKFMEVMKILGGVDLFIWSLYTQFQVLHASSTLSALTAFWKKIIGNSLPTWPFFTVYSVGHITSQQGYNNIHFWISKQARHSKTYFGSILHHAWYTSSFAQSTRELSQSTTVETSTHTVK